MLSDVCPECFLVAIQTKRDVEQEIRKISFCAGQHIVFNPDRSKASNFSLDKGGLGDVFWGGEGGAESENEIRDIRVVLHMASMQSLLKAIKFCNYICMDYTNP